MYLHKNYCVLYCEYKLVIQIHFYYGIIITLNVSTKNWKLLYIDIQNLEQSAIKEWIMPHSWTYSLYGDTQSPSYFVLQSHTHFKYYTILRTYSLLEGMLLWLTWEYPWTIWELSPKRIGRVGNYGLYSTVKLYGTPIQ